LSSGFVLIWMAKGAMTIHLIPFLLDQGFSPAFAATAAGLVGLFALPGRLIFTPLGSRIERRKVTALIFLLQAVSLVVLLVAHGRLGVFVFVALFGAGFGAITPARAALVAELYGPAHYGSINGVLALGITIGRSIAPVSAGVLFSAFHSYQPVLWILVTISAIATISALQTKSTLLPAVSPEPSR
jgi:MFS family permease